MNISFDEVTKGALNKILTEKGKSSVRLLIKGFGWSGPILGVVLDEQQEDDILETVNGITFLVDNDSADVFEDIKIIYSKGIFGETFKILTTETSNSSC
jgi:HesB-like selenoprotein